RGVRVLERRRGPNVLAADDHRMLLSEIRTDLVDGGLVRRVEFLRPARLDRVLPRPLVPELHDPTPSGLRMRVTRIRFRLSVRIGTVPLRRVENLWDFRRRSDLERGAATQCTSRASLRTCRTAPSRRLPRAAPGPILAC